MTDEQKKQEFEEWQNRNIKWLHFQISIGKIGEIIERAFLEAINIGFAYGIKTRVNTTTISDAPLESEKQLTEAKEIIKELIDTPSQLFCDNSKYLTVLAKAEAFIKE